MLQDDQQPFVIEVSVSLPLPLNLSLISNKILDIRRKFENVSGSDRPNKSMSLYRLLYDSCSMLSQLLQLDLVDDEEHWTDDILSNLLGEVSRCWVASSVSTVRSTGLWSDDSSATAPMPVE